MTTYLLIDTFNRRLISRHRSLATAVAADRKYARAVKRANGRDSYIPTMIRAAGKRVGSDSLLDSARDLTDSEIAALDRLGA